MFFHCDTCTRAAAGVGYATRAFSAMHPSINRMIATSAFGALCFSILHAACAFVRASILRYLRQCLLLLMVLMVLMAKYHVISLPVKDALHRLLVEVTP